MTGNVRQKINWRRNSKCAWNLTIFSPGGIFQIQERWLGGWEGRRAVNNFEGIKPEPTKKRGPLETLLALGLDAKGLIPSRNSGLEINCPSKGGKSSFIHVSLWHGVQCCNFCWWSAGYCQRRHKSTWGNIISS